MFEWIDGRVVEGARLEIVCTPKGYRGFESLSIRHLQQNPSQGRVLLQKNAAEGSAPS